MDARKLLAALAVLLAMLAVACQGYEGGAREQFATQFTCPGDRVEVRPRPDLKPQDVQYPNRPPPPPEIKADPERLKIWQAGEDKTLANAGTFCELWEGRGCGHQTLFCCHRPQKHANRVSCSSRDYPSGVTRY